jgi:hypothetical protein
MKTITHSMLELMANYQFAKYAEYPTDETETTCIIWHGSMRKAKGRADELPQMRMPETWANVRRYAWNLLYSQLDNKVRLRNTCGVTRCVNPDHHTRTDSFCKFGHALVGDNLHIQWATDNATGKRHSYERCRACGRLANYRQRLVKNPRQKSRKPIPS